MLALHIIDYDVYAVLLVIVTIGALLATLWEATRRPLNGVVLTLAAVATLGFGALAWNGIAVAQW